jgi:hypothetical protein
MIGSLVWKEYREQRAAWLCSAAAGSLLLLVWANTQVPGEEVVAGIPEPSGVVRWGAVILTWAYGVLCGAMLLAGERENGTLAFLDVLPRWRAQVWRAKFLAGLVLVLAQAALLGGVLVVLGVSRTASDAAGYLAASVGAGLVGMSWGAYMSARVDGVLRALWQAIIGQVLAGVGLVLVLALAGLAAGPQPAGAAWPLLPVVMLAGGLVAAVALVASARAFARLDYFRTGLHGGSKRRVAWGGAWPAAAWLTARQSWPHAVLNCLAGLCAGVAVAAGYLVAWPSAALSLSCWCGALAFTGDEVVTRRLLAEQRLPPGRFWLARVTLSAVVAALACLCSLVPVLFWKLPLLLNMTPDARWGANLLARLFDDEALGALVPAPTFLAVWPLYGFAAGVLCGQFWSRGAGAAAVAVVVGAAAAVLWLPSLAAGGLQLWQVLGLPLAMLMASRLLLPAWAAGRLLCRRSVGPLTAAAVLAGVWTAAGLWYRELEVRAPATALDVADFVRGLDERRPLEAAERCRAALAFMHRNPLLTKRATRPVFALARGPVANGLLLNQLDEVLRRGWPTDGPELARWLDRVFAGPWRIELAGALKDSPPLLVDPRSTAGPIVAVDPVVQEAQLAVKLLTAHGLRHQPGGNHATFVSDADTSLALIRALKYRTPTFAWRGAADSEDDVLSGLDRWLKRLPNRADELRRMLTVMERHEAGCPSDAVQAMRADAVAAFNTLRSPGSWMPLKGLSPVIPTTASARMAALSWREQVPWEEKRQQRVLAHLVLGGRGTVPLMDFPSAWREPAVTYAGLEWLRQIETGALSRRRAALLTVALRLYLADKGRPASSLEALTPGYLRALPADPYDVAGRPFGYRVSAGENVRIPWLDSENGQWRTGPRRLPPGYGILWSVGPDGREDGGRCDAAGASRSDPGCDQIRIVEPPQG